VYLIRKRQNYCLPMHFGAEKCTNIRFRSEHRHYGPLIQLRSLGSAVGFPRAVPLPDRLAVLKGLLRKEMKEDPTFRDERKEEWEKITKIKIHSYGNGARALHGD